MADSTLQAKKKALEVTFAHINKNYGKGSVMMLGDSPSVQADVVSTGSLQIDTALGIGGLPRGRVVEIYGPEASGKTTLALQTLAEAQKAGGICAFIDAEHALDPVYASKLGIDVNELIVSQPDYGEQALDIAETLVRSGAIDVIVVDSVAALVPKNELEGDMGDSHVGLQARLMSQALRKLTPIVHKSKTILIFINQIRHNIAGLSFGNKETTTGGNALKFYASIRLDVRRIETLKDKTGAQTGNRVKVKVAKNKMAPPFKTVVVELHFGRGISAQSDLIDLCLQYNIIKQAGSWFSYNDEKLCQGRESLLAMLRDDRALFEKLKAEVMPHLSSTIPTQQTADDESQDDVEDTE